MSPTPALSTFDAIALVVGIVIGAGIFVTPSLVAANPTAAPGGTPTTTPTWSVRAGSWRRRVRSDGV